MSYLSYIEAKAAAEEARRQRARQQQSLAQHQHNHHQQPQPQPQPPHDPELTRYGTPAIQRQLAAAAIVDPQAPDYALGPSLRGGAGASPSTCRRMFVSLSMC